MAAGIRGAEEADTSVAAASTEAVADFTAVDMPVAIMAATLAVPDTPVVDRTALEAIMPVLAVLPPDTHGLGKVAAPAIPRLDGTNSPEMATPIWDALAPQPRPGVPHLPCQVDRQLPAR